MENTLLTLEDYLRHEPHAQPGELTDEIRANAQELLRRTELLLAKAVADGIVLEADPRTGSIISSGWRPKAVNAAVPGAAQKSKHLIGQAIDLYDPDGDFDEWCWLHQRYLADVNLFIEHPGSTKGWCHLQSTPPRSQIRYALASMRRWFYP